MTFMDPLTVLQNDLSNVDKRSFDNENDRRQALAAARSLCHRLEKPMEAMLRIAWIEPTYAACLKIGVDIGLFAGLNDVTGNGGHSSEDLSKRTNTDVKLLTRILRLLSGMETIAEIGEGIYGPTDLSQALVERSVSAAVDYRFIIGNPAFQHLPSYLKMKNYQSPTELLDGPWQYAFQTSLSAFAWIGQNPVALEMFTNLMAGYTSQRGTWEEVYPIRERLLDGDEFENVNDLILVDLGGGAGHDLQRFASNFLATSQKASLVLQDLPEVIDQAKSAGGLSPNIKLVPIDFTKDVPVSGARGYFMHSVLHDWPDAEVHKILSNIHGTLSEKTVDGRTPKLLLTENVLPKKGAQLQPAALDLIMMAGFASHERTEEQWTSLLESAGYKITGIFSKTGIDGAVIEAEAIQRSS